MLQEGQEILEGRFKIMKKLGCGAFGEIFKGKPRFAFRSQRPPLNLSLERNSFLTRGPGWESSFSF